MSGRLAVALLVLAPSLARAEFEFPPQIRIGRVQSSGTDQTPRFKLNFGSGTVYTDDAANNRGTVTVTASSAGAVPTSRTLTLSAPLTIDGSSQTLDLSANRTLACATCVTTTGTQTLTNKTLTAPVISDDIFFSHTPGSNFVRPNQQTVVGTAGSSLAILGGAGANANAATAGATGGAVSVSGGAGGDGSATRAAGNGADGFYSGGDAGLNGGGGGGNGGAVYLRGGQAYDAGKTAGSAFVVGGDPNGVANLGSVNIGTENTLNIKIGTNSIPVLSGGATPGFVGGSVTTTDATVTTCMTITPTDLRAATYRFYVAAYKSTTEGAGYDFAATVRRNGATTSQIGTTTAGYAHEDTAAWDATADVTGATIRVRVTGAAASTISWVCKAVLVEAP